MAEGIRLATREDLPEIERLMRASMAALSAGFYDEQQTASASLSIAAPNSVFTSYSQP